MIIAGQFGFNYPSGFPYGKMFKCQLLLRNYKYDYSQTVHECSLDGPLQTLRFLFRYEIQNGGYGRTSNEHSCTVWL
jgi:hypothetical protein